MKVRIDAGGRVVEIETSSDVNVSADVVADKALAVWKETAEAGGGTMAGPGFGLHASERKASGPPSSNMRRAMEVPE